MSDTLCCLEHLRSCAPEAARRATASAAGRYGGRLLLIAAPRKCTSMQHAPPAVLHGWQLAVMV